MKKIMCLILVLAIAVLSGCKIPIEEINDANGLEGLDVNKEIEDKDDESVAVKGAVHTEEPKTTRIG